MEIRDSVAVITGGASGLGEAAVRAFIDKGGKVAILDLNDEKGQRLKTELGDAALFFKSDVSDGEDVARILQCVRDSFGAVHAVVNCAGFGGSMRIVGKDGIMPIEWFATRVNVNLIGTFNIIRAAAPLMIGNVPNEEGERGVFINTASIAAFDGQIGQSAYASSKGGIVSMALPLAREFANNGIRVMSILPGIMDTPLLAKNPPHVLEQLAKQVPFPPRLGKPSEFAKLACHIIENPYLNGEAIRLDGALRMGFNRK